MITPTWPSPASTAWNTSALSRGEQVTSRPSPLTTSSGCALARQDDIDVTHQVGGRRRLGAVKRSSRIPR
jgi:hypothetical protein